MIDLKYLAQTYSNLMENAHNTYLEAELAEDKRSSERILEFLSGFNKQRFRKHKLDFYSTEGASPEAIAVKPDDRDVFSIVRINKRTDGDPLRNIDIWINNGATTHNEAVLNRCWHRFCVVKEACQAVLFEAFTEDNDVDAEYPIVNNFEGVARLVDAIEDEPYSLHDFGNKDYSDESAFENAAEILAVGLLMGFEDLYELQKKIIQEYNAGDASVNIDISKINTYKIAEDHLIPLRYLELMLRWKNLGALCALIEDYN